MLPSNWPAYVLAPLLVLIASCTGVPAPSVLPPVIAGEALPPIAKPAGAVDYRVDAARSELRVLVYRGGSLASLGHNHVVTDNALAGWIRTARLAKDSAFYLQLAPADFLVDPPAARALEGADFAEQVSDEARAGTRRNMLGAALLSADRFPLIGIHGVGILGLSARGGDAQGTGPASATFRITIAGRTHLVTAPFTFERHAGWLQVAADFRLRQTELGLEPFRVLLGGLQVEDEMHLKLTVVAVADQAMALE
jgi:hypothetical protein